jgi:copper chaperone
MKRHGVEACLNCSDSVIDAIAASPLHKHALMEGQAMAEATITLSIPDMNCGHCKASVEKAVTSVDPDAFVTIDLGKRTAEIETAFGLAEFQDALAAKGYASSLIG